ncbi:MAG: glycosyltransferase family 2 protein [Lachnospiraceae bacterium]
MCKISVITPVFKVENYLRKCVDSILEQTFTDFELFIVDDGSPDSCGVIADEYAKKDSRVHVIHKENGGAPSARNAGIMEAKGEYFYFPDSDDWLEPTYLQELYDCAKRTNAQLVISGYTMEYYEDGKNQSYVVIPDAQNYGTQTMVRNNIHNYFDNMMMAVPWNKIYDASYIRNANILFPNLKWDDIHFNMEVIMNIERVAVCSSAGYHFFRSREGSETTTVFDGMLYQKRKEQFEHIMKAYKYWNIRDPQILSVIYGYYLARLVQCIQEISISDSENKRKLINDILKDELTYKAIRKGKINSKLLSIAAMPMRIKNVSGCILIGKIIGFVKIHMASLFYKLKSTSVNRARIK